MIQLLYHRKVTNEHMCTTCDVLGDEYHFVVAWQTNKDMTRNYLPPYYWQKPLLHKFVQTIAKKCNDVILVNLFLFQLCLYFKGFSFYLNLLRWHRNNTALCDISVLCQTYYLLMLNPHRLHVAYCCFKYRSILSTYGRKKQSILEKKTI